MTTSSRLTFHLEEPGEDPLSDDIFDILCNTLQPDSELPLETAVQQITALLLNARIYSREVGVFLETCYEVAEQIPYSHPSMIRLVTLIDSVLDPIAVSRQAQTGEGGSKDRYQKLGETLRGWWDSSTPAEDLSKYVNFQAFAAQLCKRGMIKGHRPALWTLETALDSKEVVEPEERNAYVKAAANWLMIYGDGIFTAIGARQWSNWKDCLEKVREGKWNGKDSPFNEETRLLAGQAVAVMIAIEGKSRI